MITAEILEKLDELSKTVSCHIYCGDRYVYASDAGHNWTVEIEYRNGKTKIENKASAETFEKALKEAWATFASVVNVGVPMALSPPVEAKALPPGTAYTHDQSHDEIPF